MVNWTIDGDIIDNSEQISLTPENLQHSLTIKSAVIGDNGDYICSIADFPLLVINKIIRLNVVKGNLWPCKQKYGIFT